MPDVDRTMHPKVLRQMVRDGKWRTSTVGMCPGYVQANLVILPRDDALDFAIFCMKNPQPCPILGVLEAGNPKVDDLAEDSDIRTDLPQYRVFKEGALVEEVDDIRHLWRDDLVTFLIGCSYTFEEALTRGGVPIRSYLQRKDVGVYVSALQCRPVGIFSGPMVVTMRPIPPHLVARAVQITSRFPKTHGAPVHIGDGASIGVPDPTKVDFGEPPDMEEGEVQVYWGCGVTPQMVALKSRVPFMITHKPCHMYVTDLTIDEVAIS
jgi:uncharacterized protein YcsI (UPF0317 family)